MRNDPRFRGNGQGPRVDPRGANPSSPSLLGLDPLGAPSPGGLGWASYYLDDNSIAAGGAGLGMFYILIDRHEQSHICLLRHRCWRR